jgi:putative transcriptional regulator
MHITYKKLWKLLIDKDLKKKDLCALANISSSSMAKMGKNENVSLEVILKICDALKCDICDVMEVESDDCE